MVPGTDSSVIYIRKKKCVIGLSWIYVTNVYIDKKIRKSIKVLIDVCTLKDKQLLTIRNVTFKHYTPINKTSQTN